MPRYGQRTLAGTNRKLASQGKAASAGIGYGVATGGTSSSITVGGVAFTMLAFTATGTLTVTRSGLFDVFSVGPGGGGGNNGRGGGAGGCITQATVFLTGNETITIAAGEGPSGATTGTTRITNNSTSLGDDVVAFSGAAGGDPVGGVGIFNGGSGGAINANGGTGFDASAFRGESALTTQVAGGGGGGSTSSTVRTGGAGGGGNGGTTSSANGVAGSVNTGGGGGGSAAGGIGAAGGSGILLVRFKV